MSAVPLAISGNAGRNFHADWALSAQPTAAAERFRRVVTKVFDEAAYRRNLICRRIPEPRIHESQSNLIEHYAKIGLPNLVDCCDWFSSPWYFVRYSQVRTENIPPLWHFVQDGIEGGCRPHPLVDFDFIQQKVSNLSFKTIDPIDWLLSGDQSALETPTSIMVDIEYIKGQFPAHGISPHKTESIFLCYLRHAHAYKLSLPDPAHQFSRIALRHAHAYKLSPHPMIDADFVFAQLRKMTSAVVTTEAGCAYALHGMQINPCRYFDTAFYMRHYGCRWPVSTPLEDFVVTGFNEMSSPHPAIGVEYLRSTLGLWRRADVFRALRGTGQAADWCDGVLPIYDLGISSLAVKKDLIVSLILQRVEKSPDIVIVMPFFRHGGGEKAVSLYCRYMLEEMPSLSIVLITETNEQSGTEWLPAAVNVLTLSGIIDPLPLSSRIEVLNTCIRMLRPRALHVCNSELGYHIIASKGDVLKAEMFLSANFFAFQFDESGEHCGFVREFFSKTRPYLGEIITDNNTFNLDILRQYGSSVSDSIKVTVVRNFAMDAAYGPSRRRFPLAGNMDIIWASRLSADKMPWLLRDIASLIPACQFKIWGRYGVGDTKCYFGDLKNLEFRGGFSKFSDIRPEPGGIFLFTTKYEGMPNVVLEAMASGMAVVAPAVGGLSEILRDGETGFVVEDKFDVESYVEALGRALKDRVTRESVAQTGQSEILARFTDTAARKDFYGSRLWAHLKSPGRKLPSR